jgi:Rrf2 family protein
MMAKIVSLSEAASIALHAMILVGRSGNGSINVDKIAEICGSSRHHVAKVMQRLAKEGFVGSFRGPNGGFFLLKKAEEISLLEIYESIEGRISPSTCPMEKQVCNFDRCFMNNITYDLTMKFKDYMTSQSLASYL